MSIERAVTGYEGIIAEIEKIPDSELSYEMVIFLAECYYNLALRDYDTNTFPLIRPNQNMLLRAARLLRTVDRRGYNDHNWCSLLGSVLQYVEYCNCAAEMYMERSLLLNPDMPRELLFNYYDEDLLKKQTENSIF